MAGLFLATLAAAPLAADNEWEPLFDGSSLEGWFNPYEWGQAAVVDGEIRLISPESKKFFLLTEKEYSDFVFEAEVRLPEGKANSGFVFRCNYEPNRVWGYQAEVDPTDRAWSGGLYDEGRRQWLHPQKPIDSEYNQKHWTEERRNAFNNGEWNHYRIQCEGERIRIWVNDVLTTDLTDDLDSKGPLGIQHHGEEGQVYRFRNLRVKEL